MYKLHSCILVFIIMRAHTFFPTCANIIFCAVYLTIRYKYNIAELKMLHCKETGIVLYFVK
jgi:hypothetical protein